MIKCQLRKKQKQTNKQTNKTDRQTDRQTDKQTDRQRMCGKTEVGKRVICWWPERRLWENIPVHIHRKARPA